MWDEDVIASLNRDKAIQSMPLKKGPFFLFSRLLTGR